MKPVRPTHRSHDFSRPGPRGHPRPPYSRRTDTAYVHWIKRDIFFPGKRHPAELGAPEATAFLTFLAVHGKVAASTQNQARSALLFLSREVLGVELPWLDDVVRAKRPQHLPVGLTRDEVRAVLQRLAGVPRFMALLLYGAGLRRLDRCRRRVKDVDVATNQIVIRTGTGGTDRVTLVPAAVKAALIAHLERAREQHHADLRPGAGWVERPNALTRTDPNAGRVDSDGNTCGHRYGANGPDIDGAGAGTGRLCLKCQAGSPGDPIL